jgi:hypothetical protein
MSSLTAGRRAPWDRYSALEVDDCYLLPSIPVPIFAAVAGDLTNEAIKNLKDKAGDKSTSIALVVGNWIRIRPANHAVPFLWQEGMSIFA